MPREVVVVGAGGFGREVLDVIEAHNSAPGRDRIDVLGVVDDSPSATHLERLQNRGVPHLGSVRRVVAERIATDYVIGIGNPQVKRELAAQFDSAGWTAVCVVHPAATVGSFTRIGDGSVVCGGVQLSTNTELGCHVHVNPGAIIGHDARLGDWVSVNPGAVISGEVEVHPGVLVGAGAVVLQGINIGAMAVVGASACVTRDIAPGQTVVGIPAKARSADGAALA